MEGVLAKLRCGKYILAETARLAYPYSVNDAICLPPMVCRVSFTEDLLSCFNVMEYGISFQESRPPRSVELVMISTSVQRDVTERRFDTYQRKRHLDLFVVAPEQERAAA